MDLVHKQQILDKQKEIYSFFTDEQLEMVNEYCRDNMKRLKKICYKRIRDICGDSNMDEDDLFSIAMDVLIKSVKTYDESQGSLDTFLYNNIYKKSDTYIRDTKYRAKRSNVQKDKDGKVTHIPNTPLDAPTDDGIDLAEKIASDFNIEDNLSEEIGFSFDEKIEKYIKELPIKVQKVALLICQAYEKSDIMRILNIEEKQYLDAMKTMRQSEYTSILF